jgi:hypothetical protein
MPWHMLILSHLEVGRQAGLLKWLPNTVCHVTFNKP